MVYDALDLIPTTKMEERVPPYKIVLTLVLATLFVAGIGLTFWTMPRQQTSVQIVQPAPTASKEIKVYVSGAVSRVGVYALKEGQRVEDAVEAAGGASAQADLSAINLAARVRDEMQIRVPVLGESGNAIAPTGDPRIDLNTASVSLLESLPGIGSVTAQNIIAYRQKNGPFKRVEDLTESKLVGASVFGRIRDLITVR